jgi:hypothetical protein
MRSVVVSMLPSLADLSKSRTLYSPSVKKSSPSRLVTFAANGSLSAPRRLSKPNAATIRQTRGYILPLVHWLSHPTSSLPFHRQTDGPAQDRFCATGTNTPSAGSA